MTENPPAQPAMSAADIAEAVRSTAILADITVAVWGAERVDAKIVEKVKADAGAKGNVGRMLKNLMAGADDKLKATRNAFIAVRHEHYALTLPWVSDPTAERMRGPRLLPNRLFDRYMTAMGLKKRDADNALNAFIESYPEDVKVAQQNLGSLVTPADYPDQAALRTLFRITFDFTPIPAASNFVGLPDDTLRKLGASLEKKQAAMLDAASGHMWERVRERLTYFIDRLSAPEPRFKNATVDHVQELRTLIPGWNVARDPRGDAVVEAIGGILRDRDGKTFRDNELFRAEAVAAARELLERMDAWGI